MTHLTEEDLVNILKLNSIEVLTNKIINKDLKNREFLDSRLCDTIQYLVSNYDYKSNILIMASKSKYTELQHKIANDIIAFFKIKEDYYAENHAMEIFEKELDNKIRLLLSYLDTKVIQNNKLTDVHVYVQCLKQFKP